jgi:hypothetical protein
MTRRKLIASVAAAEGTKIQEIWDVGGKKRQRFVTTHLISHVAHPFSLLALCGLAGSSLNPSRSDLSTWA